ncbi:MAG: tRNA (guanosine(37)-N1)-methyltransferase TrmD [Chthonomonas sp.]|nr:tRNA (guanosine(37)-N1)-methyltransferase TrmD [Chthonomonas sp.]
MLAIDFITLFPEMVLPAARHSMLARAEASGRVKFGAANPRNFSTDAHHTVDDSPFGGGPGMVMRPDVVSQAIDSVLEEGGKVLIMEPWGVPFSQPIARDLSKEKQLVLVCGHYEGIDARVQEKYGAMPISVGDYVLTGGEIPALIIADAVTRLLQGVLGDPESLNADSHADGLLSYPQYTRPWDWEGLTPPEVLRSGNHAAIAKWRRQMSLKMTQQLRPDLLEKADLDQRDRDLL